MTSLKKIAQNAENARKSTGPKTPEGKKRSSMNAIKHGLTARTAMLPDEDPEAFEKRTVGWFETVKPQNEVEASHVESAAYLSWQLKRFHRARSAALCVQAVSHPHEERHRVSGEVTTLVQTLLKTPGGRPAVLPFLAREGEERVAAGLEPATFDFRDHPAQVLGKIEASGMGCRMLVELWNQLRTALEGPLGCWRAPERFRAFRLMGVHASDACMDRDLAQIIQCCQVLNPDGGSVVAELWGDFVPANRMPAVEAMYQEELLGQPAPDRETARQILLKIIADETTGLEQFIEDHDEKAELEAEMAPDLRAVDLSPKGQLLWRYQSKCRKDLQWHINQIDKLRSDKWQKSQAAYMGGYYRPSPSRVRPSDGSEHSGAAPTETIARMRSIAVTTTTRSIPKRCRRRVLARRSTFPTGDMKPARGRKRNSEREAMRWKVRRSAPARASLLRLRGRSRRAKIRGSRQPRH